jgi:hypothetical protein
MPSSGKPKSNFLFLSSIMISCLTIFVVLGIYVKIFELSWNEVIPEMFHIKKLSFIESVAFLFVLFTIGMFLFAKNSISINYNKN